MKGKWGKALQVASVYVGTIVGAGFATGKETVEFFSRFGFLGFLGILVGGLIFIFLGGKLMVLTVKIGAKTYQEFNIFLFGQHFGSVINVLMFLMLFGVCSVMLSGAGAVFSEHLALPKSLGIVFTIFLSIIVMYYGVQGILAVNTFVVPLMIGVSLYLMTKSLFSPNFIPQFFTIFPESDSWKSFILPFSYGAFNLGLAQAVLVPVAYEVNDEEVVKWGGWMGGLFLTFILLANHFNLVLLPNFTTYEIPMAVVIKQYAPWLYGVFIFMIYGEIFTSVIGDIFGLERQIRNYVPIRSIYIVCGIFFICFLISLVNYSQLLSILYPLFGYICLSFLILLFLKRDTEEFPKF